MGYNRGNCYFTLKDDKSEIGSMIRRVHLKSLKFEPKNGMNVLIKGEINVYEPKGKYTLYVHQISEDGLGDLYIAFKQLQNKLQKEGLFEDSIKKDIPKFPNRIGVITAPTGAVIKDIITTIKRRWPLCEVILFPSLVQGKGAGENIVNQIKNTENYDLDTLIIGRGGGSIEDLWAFNEEIVARAIFECETPIISAVGHETNYTIADFVADVRAPTPSIAAELAVPKLSEIQNNLNHLNRQVNQSIKLKLGEYKSRFKYLTDKRILKNPDLIYRDQELKLDDLLMRLNFKSDSLISSKRAKLSELRGSFVFKNPDIIYESKQRDLKDLMRRLDFKSDSLISSKRAKLSELRGSFVFKNPDIIYESKQRDLKDLMRRLDFEYNSLIKANENKLLELKNSFVFRNPFVIVNNKKRDYNHIKLGLEHSSEILLNKKENDLIKYKQSHSLKNPYNIVTEKRVQWAKNIDKLDILNPLNTLKRGYTLAKVDDKVVSSSKTLKKGDKLEVKFKDGSVNTEVI